MVNIFEQLQAEGVDVSPPSDARQVYKYALSMDMDEGKAVLELPLGAGFLAVDVQPNGPVAWFSVYPDAADKESRTFAWVKTGVDFPSSWAYLGSTSVTIVTPKGPKSLVSHLFEAL